MRRLPAGFLEQVIEYRLYAHAKAANEADPKGWNSSPMRVLAQTIEMELTQKELPES